MVRGCYPMGRYLPTRYHGYPWQGSYALSSFHRISRGQVRQRACNPFDLSPPTASHFRGVLLFDDHLTAFRSVRSAIFEAQLWCVILGVICGLCGFHIFSYLSFRLLGTGIVSAPGYFRWSRRLVLAFSSRDRGDRGESFSSFGHIAKPHKRM